MSDLKAMLIRHEGMRNKLYTDTAGKVSIGIGRDLTDVGLNNAEIDLLFANDLAATQAWVARDIPCFKNLSPNRQNVIIDMAFNLRGRLLGFTKFLAALSSGDYDTAAVEMIASAWAGQVGSRAVELAAMMKAG
jgi:GH24 family phage-related lysozyme (muramidase)